MVHSCTCLPDEMLASIIMVVEGSRLRLDCSNEPQEGFDNKDRQIDRQSQGALDLKKT
jgi:hypothetical protein